MYIHPSWFQFMIHTRRWQTIRRGKKCGSTFVERELRICSKGIVPCVFEWLPLFLFFANCFCFFNFISLSVLLFSPFFASPSPCMHPWPQYTSLSVFFLFYWRNERRGRSNEAKRGGAEKFFFLILWSFGTPRRPFYCTGRMPFFVFFFLLSC